MESLHYLPEGIVEEILVRLAVKSLLRFRCVSKSWISLIDNKRFFKIHLQHSIKNKDSADHSVLMFTDSKTKQSKQCSLRALLAATDLSPLCHPISQDPLRSELFYNACCCNGLLCIYQRQHFLLLNPTTSVSKELPKDPEIDKFMEKGQVIKIGFGWDESSGAYKVFASWYGRNRSPCHIGYRGRVYSSKTNSWKAVEDPYSSTTLGEGKFVGGKLHWLSRPMKIISSLDVKSEVFGTIELPEQTKDRCFLMLGVVGGCLCLSYDFYDDQKKAFDVWVMKESWEKLLTIHLVGKPHHALNTRFAPVIGEAGNGEILIDCGSSLLVYCPKNCVIRHSRVTGSYFKVHLCVESLVSPVTEISSLDI